MGSDPASDTGIVLFAHGSRVVEANAAVDAVAAAMARAGGFAHVISAFLDLASPDLGEAVDRLVAGGYRRILVVPYFLTLGTHLQRDLPAIAAEQARLHPGVDIRLSPPLDGHEALTEILVDRAREALSSWEEAFKPSS